MKKQVLNKLEIMNEIVSLERQMIDGFLALDHRAMRHLELNLLDHKSQLKKALKAERKLNEGVK